MSYTRRQVVDHETVMNKDLYDNLQDGIEEAKAGNQLLEKSLEDTKTSLTDDIEETKSIAKGRNKARVFSTTQSMKDWLSDVKNKGVCNVGDNLYIVDVGVPDWWVSEVLNDADEETGYYYKISQLETQKVDLSEYDQKIKELEYIIEQQNDKINGYIISRDVSFDEYSLKSGETGTIRKEYPVIEGYEAIFAICQSTGHGYVLLWGCNVTEDSVVLRIYNSMNSPISNQPNAGATVFYRKIVGIGSNQDTVTFSARAVVGKTASGIYSSSQIPFLNADKYNIVATSTAGIIGGIVGVTPYGFSVWFRGEVSVDFVAINVTATKK